MARMLVFTKDADKFPVGSVVFYETATGKTVQAAPGDSVLAAAMVQPSAAECVAAGLATIEGEDDGATGMAMLVTRRLREVCANFRLLDGPQTSWTMEQMLEAFRNVKATDEAAMASWVTAGKGKTDKPAGETPKAHAGKAATRK